MLYACFARSAATRTSLSNFLIRYKSELIECVCLCTFLIAEIDKYYSVLEIFNKLPELEKMVDNASGEIQTEFIKVLGETCEEVAFLSSSKNIYNVANNIAKEFEDGLKFGTYAKNSVKNCFNELNRIFEEKIKKHK